MASPHIVYGPITVITIVTNANNPQGRQLVGKGCNLSGTAGSPTYLSRRAYPCIHAWRSAVKQTVCTQLQVRMYNVHLEWSRCSGTQARVWQSNGRTNCTNGVQNTIHCNHPYGMDELLEHWTRTLIKGPAGWRVNYSSRAIKTIAEATAVSSGGSKVLQREYKLSVAYFRLAAFMNFFSCTLPPERSPMRLRISGIFCFGFLRTTANVSP